MKSTFRQGLVLRTGRRGPQTRKSVDLLHKPLAGEYRERGRPWPRAGFQIAITAFLVCLGVAWLFSVPARAQESGPSARSLALRAQILRLAEVDWRLRVAARPLCTHLAPGHGLWLDHSLAYSNLGADNTVRTLRLGKLPQIAAVAASSPAALVGLRPGDEIEAINEMSVDNLLARSQDPSLFAEDVADYVAGLSLERPVSLILRRGKMSLRKSVQPVAICAGRTFLEPNTSIEAHTDNTEISLTTSMVDFAANDDELALIVAHELAHVILATDDEADTGLSALEAKADLLGLSIAHCAGYNVRKSIAFWSRVETQKIHPSASTHPPPAERKDRLIQALAGLTCPVRLPDAMPPR